MAAHWLKKHAGSRAGSEAVAAPRSVSAVLSHLEKEMKKLGRTGEWDPRTLTGTISPWNGPQN